MLRCDKEVEAVVVIAVVIGTHGVDGIRRGTMSGPDAEEQSVLEEEELQQVQDEVVENSESEQGADGEETVDVDVDDDLVEGLDETGSEITALELSFRRQLREVSFWH